MQITRIIVCSLFVGLLALPVFLLSWAAGSTALLMVVAISMACLLLLGLFDPSPKVKHASALRLETPQDDR